MAVRTQLSQLAKLLLGIWMAGVVVSMFLIIPQYAGLGDAGRIIIMHVPMAWVTSLAFAVSAIYSALYLWRRNPGQRCLRSRGGRGRLCVLHPGHRHRLNFRPDRLGRVLELGSA